MRRQRTMLCMLTTLLVTAATTRLSDAEDGKVPSAAQLMEKAVKQWESVRTFRATFTRRERLPGKDTLGPKEVIFLRERQKPFSIYLHWLDGPGKDRSIAYIEGTNDGKIKVTPGGALGWMVLDMMPDDPEVMKKSRHTILEAGLGPLIRKIDEQFELAGSDVRSKYKGKVNFHGRPCHQFYRYTPQKPGYYCWKAEILFDEEFGFPLYVKVFDWQRSAFEEYSYTDIEFNPDYTDEHFHIRAAPRE